jgi:hypothetical protein
MGSAVTKVLYVEHNDDNRYMLKTRLELLGDFEVLAADDSEKGCKLAATEHPSATIVVAPSCRAAPDAARCGLCDAPDASPCDLRGVPDDAPYDPSAAPDDAPCPLARPSVQRSARPAAEPQHLRSLAS